LTTYENHYRHNNFVSCSYVVFTTGSVFDFSFWNAIGGGGQSTAGISSVRGRFLANLDIARFSNCDGCGA
jgi:hypothetical protein